MSAIETLYNVHIAGVQTDLKQYSIDNRDIISFTFVEDIFSMLSMAKFQFIDRKGVQQALGIRGKELVNILYGPDPAGNDPTKQKALTFMNYDMTFKSELQTTGSGVNQLTMNMVDPLFIPMHFQKYSKSWKEEIGTSIIKDVCKNMIGSGKSEMEFNMFEECKESFDFLMSYWSPAEAIKWLLRRMTGSETGAPGYLFFYNTGGDKGGYNLISLSNLLNKSPDPKKYFFTSTNPEDYYDENRILAHKVWPPSNQALSKLPGSIKASPDFMTKDMRENICFDSHQTEKYKSIFHGEDPIFTPVDTSNTKVDCVSGDYSSLYTQYGSDWIKTYMKQMQLDLYVKGHAKRHAGMLIDVEWGAINEGIANENYTGRYLVKSITHQFCPSRQPQYRQLLVCVKTAFKDTVTGGALK